MSWLRRSRSSHLALPAEVVAEVPAESRLLAAVPVSADGRRWLVACQDGLRGVEVGSAEAAAAGGAGGDEVEVGAAGSAATAGGAAADEPEVKAAGAAEPWCWDGLTGWDQVTRARWDAEERCFSFHVLHERRARLLRVPAALRQGKPDGGWESVDVDESAFGRVVRQQVERAIVHYVSQTLSDGLRVTASIRRRGDGSLYAVLDPALESLDAGQREAAQALLRQVRDGVGLPTP